MRPRLWIPDFLKGLSIIFMVQDHIFETWIQQDLLFTQAGSVIQFLNNFPAAGIFMLTMGFTARYTEANAGKLFKRGVKVFFWGFLLNVGLNLHYFIRIISNRVEGNVLDSLFAVDIFYLAGLSLLILGVVKLLSNSWIISISGAILIAVISPYITDLLASTNQGGYILSFVAKPTAWSFFPIFPWASYTLAGYGFSQLLLKYPGLKKVSWGHYIGIIVLLTVSGFGFIKNWNDLGNLAAYYHHGIKIFVWISSMGLGLTILLQIFQNFQRGSFSAWVLFIGSKLTRFYIIQWLIIGNLASFYYQQLNLGMYFMGSILALGLTTIIVFLMKDFKISIGHA